MHTVTKQPACQPARQRLATRNVRTASRSLALNLVPCFYSDCRRLSPSVAKWVGLLRTTLAGGVKKATYVQEQQQVDRQVLLTLEVRDVNDDSAASAAFGLRLACNVHHFRCLA